MVVYRIFRLCFCNSKTPYLIEGTQTITYYIDHWDSMEKLNNQIYYVSFLGLLRWLYRVWICTIKYHWNLDFGAFTTFLSGKVLSCGSKMRVWSKAALLQTGQPRQNRVAVAQWHHHSVFSARVQCVYLRTLRHNCSL